jgi:ligand-binding SRPBCC domain-containing protein
MRVRWFESHVWLPLSPKELFPFFADAGNLDAITPTWLHFKIVTPLPIAMSEGAVIDYRLRLWGVRMRWRTRINVWQPPIQFVDEQVLGPYRQWIHTHTFEPCDGGTLARDVVHYAVPLDLVAHPFVRRDVVRIFKHRNAALQRRFGSRKPEP